MDELRTFVFGKGSHGSREDGMCFMEHEALLGGYNHSDNHKTACPVCRPLFIWLNDSCKDDGALRCELLSPFVLRTLGSKGSRSIQQQRAYMAADWAVRFVCPILFRRAGLVKEAATLESLAEINSKDAALAADAAAYAAADAATHAAADAAAHAARPRLTRRLARATRAAAHAAHAARAAHAAAHATRAARAADDLEIVQRSLAALLDKMIRLTEPQERACGNVRSEFRETTTGAGQPVKV